MSEDDEAPEDDYFLREKFVSLGHDWGAGPYFWDSEGGAVPLQKLPISPALRDRYERWFYWYANRHEAGGETLREKDNAPFPDLTEFAEEGHAIAHAIKCELPEWRVSYRDYFTRKDIKL